MSNVLIGIIGVILFIGLALAGALFLGPRFQESTSNSKAAAAVQAVSQVASAANLYRVNTGTPLIGVSHNTTRQDTYTLKDQGYLKSMPSNPTSSTNGIGLVADNGATGTGTNAFYVLMSLGADKGICDSIIRQTGQGQSATITYTISQTNLPGNAGCIKTGSNGTIGAADNDYMVYARI